MPNKKVQIMADLALIFVTAVWGATFVSVKEAITHIMPYYFLAIRFGLATIILLIITNRRLKKITWPVLGKGILIGLMLFAGYTFQTIGLQYTSASNAGFITGLSVVLVPVFMAVTTKKLPSLIPGMGIISATLGLALLTMNSSLKFNLGDILTLFCAVSYALHIMLVGKFSPGTDSFNLTTIQIGTVAVASIIFAFFQEKAPVASSFNVQVIQAILITAVFATALAFFVQTWTQKYTSPTHTAIIFTMEPVFAALVAFLVGGESFAFRQGLGAFCILLGMLASELGGLSKAKDEVTQDSLKV